MRLRSDSHGRWPKGSWGMTEEEPKRGGLGVTKERWLKRVVRREG